MVFTFLMTEKKKSKNLIFRDIWKSYEIEMLVPTKNVLLTVMLSHFHTVCGCFCAIPAEVVSCNRDCVPQSLEYLLSDPSQKRSAYPCSLIAQLVKNLPVMQETLVWSLGQEDTLEKGQATHSSILGVPFGSAGKESAHSAGDLGSIPGLERPPGEGKGYPFQYSGLENSIQSMGSQRVGHDWVTFTFISVPRWW